MSKVDRSSLDFVKVMAVASALQAGAAHRPIQASALADAGDTNAQNAIGMAALLGNNRRKAVPKLSFAIDIPL